MAGAPKIWKSPQDVCNGLLQSLRESNLHFIVSESPYSVQICIRKKFLNKTSAPLLTSLTGRKDLENKIEDLSNERASLIDCLENLRNTNKILQDRNQSAENDMFEICKEKKKEVKKFEDETALQNVKIKSLEKSLIAKDKKIKDSKNKVENARNTIAKLEAEIATLTTSETKLKSVGGKKAVEEFLANDNMTDDNENLLVTLPVEPKSRSKQETDISCLPSCASPVRRGSTTRATPGTPPSPHTPRGVPPPTFIRSELQSTALTSPTTTLSCYFAKSVPDHVNEVNPISEEYIRNLSKLNLAPRIRKQEDT